jgi:uncharacterized protein (TIGR03790 family)
MIGANVAESTVTWYKWFAGASQTGYIPRRRVPVYGQIASLKGLYRMRLRQKSLVGLCLLFTALPAYALGPENVFLVVNRNVSESTEVADHYCRKRNVPRGNIIDLDLPAGEDISREDYDQKLVMPLRAALKDRREKARVLLSIYGVPLRVGRQLPSAAEKAELDRLRPQIDRLQVARQNLEKDIATFEAKVNNSSSAELLQVLQERRKQRDTLGSQYAPLQDRQRRLSYAESEACVDSELALLWWDNYDLNRWQANLNYFQVPDVVRWSKPPVLMVSRLDGPSAALAKNLVDQAVEIEAKGLVGRVYVDARGIKYDPSKDAGFGYGAYDESLREMARLLQDNAKLPVTLDDKPELFAPGSCPECALYCGWYSLGNYVNCCRFVPGAVAYHIASAEAVSLRNTQSKLWCKCLLENGVAATLGPVAEPYTFGFPKPAEFFGFLLTGRYTLVECYSKTSLLNSWMTVLVGDPLYNPFAKTPKLTPEQVKPSPEGRKFILQGK